MGKRRPGAQPCLVGGGALASPHSFRTLGAERLGSGVGDQSSDSGGQVVPSLAARHLGP